MDTYHVVLDPINAGVGFSIDTRLVQAVLNGVDSEDTNLLESPGGNALGELPVPGTDGLATSLLDLGIEPLVREHLGSPNEGKASRVSALECGDQTKLLTNGEELLGIDSVGLFFGIIAVGGARSLQDRGEKGTLSKSMTNTAGESDEL